MSRRARKPKQAEKENTERWLLTYADLITLLLAFFIVMWSIGQTDLKKFDQVRDSLANAFNTGIGDSSNGTSPLFDEGSNFDPSPFGMQQTDLSTIQKRFNDLANKYGVADKITIRTEQNEIVISLSDNLLFDSASAHLRPESLGVLDETAAILKTLPNDLRIEGHTDNIPINTGEFNSNWELSAARATSVLRYLVENGGIRAERVFAAGYGDTRPVADNSTGVGRSANRRADIVIIYPNPSDSSTPPASPTADASTTPQE
jgi:chemotaxis protein MotB